MTLTLCAYAWIAAWMPFCGALPAAEAYLGYVEGETRLIAPDQPGRLVEVAVRRGALVKKGALLFRLEDLEAREALATAEAELARLQAERADLQLGRRSEEIDVTKAQLREAEAALREAELQHGRQRDLFAQKVVAAATLDRTRSSLEAAQARVDTLRGQIAVQQMPARKDAIAAATARIKAQEARVTQARWRLQQRTVHAPVAGVIETIIRDPGEMAGPAAPVVSLLPPENRFIRFFLPEHIRAQVHPGNEVIVACDSCPQTYRATVSYVSVQAEYAPPVIYSVERRDKLVYMVEARPNTPASVLDPGQPVTVTLNAGDQTARAP